MLGLFQKQMEACYIRGLFWFRPPKECAPEVVEIARGCTTICGHVFKDTTPVRLRFTLARLRLRGKDLLE